MVRRNAIKSSTYRQNGLKVVLTDAIDLSRVQLSLGMTLD